MKKILFICTGNICRSPSADGILRAKIAKLGLESMISVDSAGTSRFHVGQSPDPRSSQAALKRGYDLSPLRARSVKTTDFDDFDLLLALDGGHEQELHERAPTHHAHKIKLFLPYVGVAHPREVPDPYYGGADGFEDVLDMLEIGCDALIHKILDEMEEDHGCISHGACGCAR